MKRTKLVLVGVALLAVLAASPAQAITFGQLDGNRHPQVGALVAEYNAPGVKDVLCTGTLISPTVFLSAGHCTDYLTSIGTDPHDIWVTFDPSFDADSPLIRGTFHTDPDYGFSGPGGFSDAHDLSVTVLDTPVTSVTPARLPTRNLLSRLDLRGQRFTAVGYGTVRTIKQTGPNALFWDPQRRFAGQGFLALRPRWLSLSMNPSTGSGGTCYGDSGGPHFLGGVTGNKIVSVTVTGDTACRATDVTYRLDTDSARAFLDDYVTLP
jgi:Trypsin